MFRCNYPQTAILLALMLLAAACGSSNQATSPTSTTEASSEVTPSTEVVTPESQSAVDDPRDIADTVLYNASIATVDGSFTIVEAIAIKDGDVLATGPSTQILTLSGPDTIVIDLDQRTVIPGFVDPHSHLSQLPAPDLVAMKAAHEEMLAAGITTVGIPSVEPEELEAFRELDAAGDLTTRTHLYPVYNTVCGGRDYGGFHLENEFSRNPELTLAVAGVKIYTDGGVCNAPAVSFEYPPSVPQGLKDSGWTGRGALYVSPDELASVVREVDSAGGLTVIHGIGDVGLRTALEGLELASSEGQLAQPHRIDHNTMATLLSEDELALYGKLGLVPVIQLLPWASACEEGRSELWASILPEPAYSSVEDRTAIANQNPGIRFSWHSDNPWVPGTPLQQLFSVVSGGAIHDDGSGVCYPEAWDWFPTVEIEQAIEMVTINGAAAMGIEDKVGSLEPGKTADLVVLANNIFDADPEVGLATNHPEVTMVNGVVVACDGPLCDEMAAK